MSKEIDQYIDEATTNIREDRKRASEVLEYLMDGLDEEDVEPPVGSIAKVLETMQRSNEQLVKMTGMLLKERARSYEEEAADLTDGEAESIYDDISVKEG